MSKTLKNEDDDDDNNNNSFYSTNLQKKREMAQKKIFQIINNSLQVFKRQRSYEGCATRKCAWATVIVCLLMNRGGFSTGSFVQ